MRRFTARSGLAIYRVEVPESVSVLHLDIVMAFDEADAQEQTDELASLRSALTDLGGELSAVRGSEPEPGTKGVLGEIMPNLHVIVGMPIIAIHTRELYEWAARRKHRRLRISGPQGQSISIPDTPLEEAQRLLPLWASDLPQTPREE